MINQHRLFSKYVSKKKKNLSNKVLLILYSKVILSPKIKNCLQDITNRNILYPKVCYFVKNTKLTLLSKKV